MNKPTAIVTGDIVLDSHLYGGVKVSANTFQEPGTVYCSHLGGACLTRKILAAAADAKGRAWDKKKQDWENEVRAQAKTKLELMSQELKAQGLTEPVQPESQPPPIDLQLNRPQPAYSAHLGIDEQALSASLPGNLHSFGVWTPHPAGKDPAPVWRVQRHFGYGSVRKDGPRPEFQRAQNCPADPALILLDDGGILFRQEVAKPAWPTLTPASPESEPPFIVLKMSSPLCGGDLWPTISEQKAVTERLLVIVSAADLRQQDAQIRQQLSWEQCASDALRALHEGPRTRELLRARHVIVAFGSEGALWLHRKEAEGDHDVHLIYDPVQMEGDFSQDFKGTVYGFQTCLAVAIAHHLLQVSLSPDKIDKAVVAGIVSGLNAKQKFLELGHGPVGSDSPGFPIEDIGQVIANCLGGFVQAPVPSLEELNAPCTWSILARAQRADSSQQSIQAKPQPPHIGLAQLTAIYGRAALSDVPSLAKDKLFTVDRSEIESLRTLERLMGEYERSAVQKKPLSIGVFGPPGAGKSFGVKALAKAILGDKVPILEFNLSQFTGTEDLIGALHRVRDEVLKGTTPVAFWDEFDSQQYKWLQYLLAPMQDGAFQEGQITHPIGKCIFIFAGGTASTLESFGIREPAELSQEKRQELTGDRREDRMLEEEAYRQFKLLKGPDFISRLHGHLDVLGPNPRKNGAGDCPDLTWPIRRALMLRGVLGLKDNPKQPGVLKMDPGLLYALLGVPVYKHGARSLEKILQTLAQDMQGDRYHRSALPPDPLLDRETSAQEFHTLMNQRNAFQTNPDIEKLAAAIHENYLNNAKIKGWPVKPELAKPYAELAPDYQASNRAAARRIPDHLSLIDFKVIPNPDPNDDSWIPALKTQIDTHLERLAQAEHLGWNDERFANGWKLAPERNDALKQHNLLVDWAELSDKDKDKDRTNMKDIPTWLKLANYMAVPV